MYSIKNPKQLRTLLWWDFGLGVSCGLIGLVFCNQLYPVLGLSYQLLFWISLVTLFYSIFAFVLARLKEVNITATRVLIYANWLWAIISLGFIYFHFNKASILGKAFLILQIIVVGGLAYLESKQIVKQ